MHNKEKLLILKKFVTEQIQEYRSMWKEELCESEDIEIYGRNEYVGGKADTLEDILLKINELLNVK